MKFFPSESSINLIFAGLNGKAEIMKYPVGIQTFENIRRDGYVYVDKTEYVYKLASTGKCYFLSRPRRFGKSLLISTFDAYFGGKKELFQGLAIEKLEKDWVKYPVLRFDMSVGKVVKTVEDICETMNIVLAGYEKIYGADPAETTIELRFRGIITRAFEKEGCKVVILIDEYDKPLLDTIDNREENDRVRDFLRGFYGNVKSQDQYIRFAFLTGITKFSHVNIFSGLNNLEDISMVPQYASICGISESELTACFKESIGDLAESEGMTFEKTCDRLKEQYDGYHFYQNTEGLFNPFSLLRTFKSGVFANYWFGTGTPTYLVKLLQRNGYEIPKLEGVRQTRDQLEGLDSIDVNIVPLLYQSGYLTIVGYDRDFGDYILNYPNREVEEGFHYLLSSLCRSKSR